MKKISCSTLSTLLFILSAAPFIQANPGGSGAPTLAELRDATYAGMEDGSISLSDGGWEGAPYVEGGASRPRVGLVEDVYLTGDLNGDGAQEAVVILWRSSGGSGSNTYVAVMARQNDEISNIGTALIGDRVKLRSGKVADGNITLKFFRLVKKMPCVVRQSLLYAHGRCKAVNWKREKLKWSVSFPWIFWMAVNGL